MPTIRCNYPLPMHIKYPATLLWQQPPAQALQCLRQFLMVCGFDKILICAVCITKYTTVQIPSRSQHHDTYIRILLPVPDCYGISTLTWKIQVQQQYVCGLYCELSVQLISIQDSSDIQSKEFQRCHQDIAKIWVVFHQQDFDRIQGFHIGFDVEELPIMLGCTGHTSCNVG